MDLVNQVQDGKDFDKVSLVVVELMYGLINKEKKEAENESMSHDQILNIVAFCILMENNEGVVGKSPDYIIEKYNRYARINSQRHEGWAWGLDRGNEAKIKTWQDRWGSKA